VPTIWHSAKRVFTECLLWTLCKESGTHLCRVPAIWHSAKNILKLKNFAECQIGGTWQRLKIYRSPGILSPSSSSPLTHTLSTAPPRAAAPLTASPRAPRRLTPRRRAPLPASPLRRRAPLSASPLCRRAPLPASPHCPPRGLSRHAPTPSSRRAPTPSRSRPSPRCTVHAEHKVQTLFEIFVAKYYEIEVCLL
jgi:hypothetical protein